MKLFPSWYDYFCGGILALFIAPHFVEDPLRALNMVSLCWITHLWTKDNWRRDINDLLKRLVNALDEARDKGRSEVDI